MRLLSL